MNKKSKCKQESNCYKPVSPIVRAFGIFHIIHLVESNKCGFLKFSSIISISLRTQSKAGRKKSIHENIHDLNLSYLHWNTFSPKKKHENGKQNMSKSPHINHILKKFFLGLFSICGICL